MKFVMSFLLTGLFSFILCLYLPWWSVAVVALLVNLLLHQRPLFAFLSGLTAVFLLWVLLAALINSSNQGILAHRISQIILKTDDPAGLILLTGAIGALVAGFAALAGSFCRREETGH